MPLEKGKSPEAFKHNLKAEMKAGKPMKQSLAIAYSMKRKKKMADGGKVEPKPSPSPTGYENAGQSLKTDKDNPVLKSIQAAFAEGGQITDNYQPAKERTSPDLADHEMDHGYVSHPGNDVVPCAHCGAEDARGLGQHGAHEEGPQGGGQGFHGESYKGNPGNAWDNYSESEDGDGQDMIGRIMKQRQQMYSEGGKVANSDEIEAGFSPNEFDDLHLRDDLEEHYTGANSGDEIGDAQEDADRRDIVSKIMKSRAKKDRLPRPA